MHASLTLSTQLRHGKTWLRDHFVSPPLKLLTLPHLADGSLHAIQMSASPGLLAGDSVAVLLTLAEHTRLRLDTQAYTRVLSMTSPQSASQSNHITLAPHSQLVYLPHPLVLHSGSSLQQRTHIELGDSCRLLYGEIIAAGRVLNGEKFAFAHLSSHLEIVHAQKLLVHDNIQWLPERHTLNQLSQMEGYTHQASLYFINTTPATELKTQLDTLYEVLLPRFGEQTLLGMSLAAPNVICLRALANQAEPLEHLLKAAAKQLSTDEIK